jgi:FimV-like protein
MFIILGPLAWGSASVQGSDVLSNPVPPNNPEKSDTRPATSFQLKGVLISDFERTALVNGELVQEGDRIGGVEILAIDQAGVRVLAGAQELTVDVGGTFVGDQSVVDQSSNDVTRVSRIDASLRHAVKPGETLSGIALQYLEDGVTMNEMMIALFQANTQAFDDNINVLYEGATLRIPDQDELDHQVPETATAEVTRHREMWQATHHQETRIASLVSDKQYGPVESGETLSAIAASVLHDGATMNQMMIALYEANPRAFSNNINLLREGAVLRIPDAHELRRQTPEMATAEVARQTKAWQTGDEQFALFTLAHNDVLASGNELIN